MTELQKTQPVAWKFLKDPKPGKESWCQYCIVESGYPTFCAKTSNASEQTNAWLGVLLRAADPVSAFYMSMVKLLDRFEKMRDTYRGLSSGSLVKIVQVECNKLRDLTKEYAAMENSSSAAEPQCQKFLVFRTSQKGFLHRRTQTVDIVNSTCTCGR
ncbi:hypothetical protein AC1031_005764 [Aphanomyces cochlioides]|nr:hypothetical protein AC1031_005764 [Aphanomyces cochlioides]